MPKGIIYCIRSYLGCKCMSYANHKHEQNNPTTPQSLSSFQCLLLLIVALKQKKVLRPFFQVATFTKCLLVTT